MKTMRIPLLVAWAVAVLGVVLGSFFDLDISRAIASPANGFALTVSVLGPTIAFMPVAAMGGGFISLAVKGQYHIGLKVLFYILSAACLGVSIYFAGGEYFDINGFHKAAPEWLGYLIALVPEGAALVGGYFLFRKNENPNIWILFLIIIVLETLAIAVVVPLIKNNMHRPRYRLVSTSDVTFHAWWEPCPEYKDLIIATGTHSDNFKSFPSGHTSEASIMLITATFLPLVFKKTEKIHLPLFVGAWAFVLLIAFARILAAAHYLSDVSMGATITLTSLFVTNEIVIRIKKLHPEEPVSE